MTEAEKRPTGAGGAGKTGHPDYTPRSGKVQAGGGLLESALVYARWGWPVHPLHPGTKIPIVKDWPDKASTDPATLRKWWAQWPTANIGLQPGAAGLVVIDLDVKGAANGLETWHQLTTQHNIDDDTVTSLTPSGGQHLVFCTNGAMVGNSSSELGAGVDVKAERGNIVLPPSELAEGGAYVWDVGHHPGDHDPAPLPAALLRLLLATDTTRGPSPPVAGDIATTHRNTTLASLGGTMRRRGMTEGAILAALLAENETRCKPPLALAEVQRIAASMASYAPAPVAHPEAGAMATTTPPETFHLTDLGNSERLQAQHGGDLAWCDPWAQWLAWDTRRWKVDDTREVERRAMRTVRDLYTEAGNEPDPDRRAALGKWAGKCESGHRRREMANGARALLPILPDDLDRDPWLLTVNNGTLDLRTGELGPHLREDRITKLAPVDYEPGAQAPTWTAFLDRIMAGNQNLIAFLQRAVGYALTGDVREQCFFILYGTGANGKSTFLEALAALWADYASKTNSKTLLVKRGDGIREDIARLKGARLVTAIETEQGHRLAEALVKEMTGGDTLAARFLYGRTFEFKAEFKLFLATNHRPTIRGTDLAIWRRIRLIPFTVTIPEPEQDKDLPAKLAAELPGILAWAVRGCLEWQRHGLGMPPEVAKATASYQAEQDVLGGFLEDCCVVEDTATARAGELYQTYRDWCEQNGERPLSGRAFSQQMLERGFDKYKERTGIHYTRIGLLATGRDV